jgi:hypothetical protein
MRAQQAFTVLPYDAFLFMAIQALLAAQLNVDVGDYFHFSGTFHVYEKEESAIRETLEYGVRSAVIPRPPAGAAGVAAFIEDLIALEATIRGLALVGDRSALVREAQRTREGELLSLAGKILSSFALSKLGDAEGASSAILGVPSDIRDLCWSEPSYGDAR